MLGIRTGHLLNTGFDRHFCEQLSSSTPNLADVGKNKDMSSRKKECVGERRSERITMDEVSQGPPHLLNV